MGLATIVLFGCGENAPSGSPGDSQESAENAASQSSAPKKDEHVLERLKAGGFTQSWRLPDDSQINFVISIPQSVDGEEPLPLVLALHFGADRYYRFFGAGLLKNLILPGFEDFQAIVVAPDVIENTWTNKRCEESVMALMAEVCKTYNVDRDRILVTGFSLGGRGTWHFASRYPEFFTAALPIAGCPPDNYREINWTVPMLCIQSAADEVFPIARTRDAIDELQKQHNGNLTIQLYEVEDVSHYESAKYVEPIRYAMTWVQQVWDARVAEAAD
jgi:predicted peptidase